MQLMEETIRPDTTNQYLLIDYTTLGPLNKRVLRHKTIDPLLVLKVWDLRDGSIKVELFDYMGSKNPILVTVPSKEWKIECVDEYNKVIYYIGYSI